MSATDDFAVMSVTMELMVWVSMVVGCSSLTSASEIQFNGSRCYSPHHPHITLQALQDFPHNLFSHLKKSLVSEKEAFRICNSWYL